MVNSRRVGNQSVVQCEKFFKSNGYITSRVELSGKFREYKDMFSEWFAEQGFAAGFDLVALNKEEMLLVQVTTTKPKTHKPFQLFADTFPKTTVVQFVRVKGRAKNLLVEYFSGAKHVVSEV